MLCYHYFTLPSILICQSLILSCHFNFTLISVSRPSHSNHTRITLSMFSAEELLYSRPTHTRPPITHRRTSFITLGSPPLPPSPLPPSLPCPPSPSSRFSSPFFGVALRLHLSLLPPPPPLLLFPIFCPVPPLPIFPFLLSFPVSWHTPSYTSLSSSFPFFCLLRFPQPSSFLNNLPYI